MLVRKEPAAQAEVVEGIPGGMPCVSGTRIPAGAALAYLRKGYTDRAVREDYPTLPIDGIEAVERWARANGLDLGKRGEVLRFQHG